VVLRVIDSVCTSSLARGYQCFGGIKFLHLQERNEPTLESERRMTEGRIHQLEPGMGTKPLRGAIGAAESEKDLGADFVKL
jgi:hypothetical protein